MVIMLTCSGKSRQLHDQQHQAVGAIGGPTITQHWNGGPSRLMSCHVYVRLLNARKYC